MFSAYSFGFSVLTTLSFFVQGSLLGFLLFLSEAFGFALLMFFSSALVFLFPSPLETFFSGFLSAFVFLGEFVC